MLLVLNIDLSIRSGIRQGWRRFRVSAGVETSFNSVSNRGYCSNRSNLGNRSNDSNHYNRSNLGNFAVLPVTVVSMVDNRLVTKATLLWLVVLWFRGCDITSTIFNQ